MPPTLPSETGEDLPYAAGQSGCESLEVDLGEKGDS